MLCVCVSDNPGVKLCLDEVDRNEVCSSPSSRLRNVYEGKQNLLC